MSRHGLTFQPWGEREYAFRLGLDEIEWLEAKFELSIFELVQSIRDRKAPTEQIRSVLVVAMIGGGLAEADAAHQVTKNLDEMPLEIGRDLAYAVGLAALARATPEELDDSKEGKSVWARLSALILPIFGWLRPAARSKTLAS